MIRPSVPRLALGFATVAVVGAVAGGVWLMGAPSDERLRRLDDRRVSDLVAMSRSVDMFFKRHGRLPESLDEVSGEPGLGVAVNDPETGLEYRYRKMDDDNYRLCARFALDSSGDGQEVRGNAPGTWSHGAGKQCFYLEVRGRDR